MHRLSFHLHEVNKHLSHTFTKVAGRGRVMASVLSIMENYHLSFKTSLHAQWRPENMDAEGHATRFYEPEISRPLLMPLDLQE